MTDFASCIDFLNREHRRFDSERAQWAMEREKLQENLSVLEREVKSSEKIKLELAKRVKMLEHALMKEREEAGYGVRELDRNVGDEQRNGLEEKVIVAETAKVVENTEVEAELAMDCVKMLASKEAQLEVKAAEELQTQPVMLRIKNGKSGGLIMVLLSCKCRSD